MIPQWFQNECKMGYKTLGYNARNISVNDLIDQKLRVLSSDM
jgi:hypothetical protein